jgi:hypothetical protein
MMTLLNGRMEILFPRRLNVKSVVTLFGNWGKFVEDIALCTRWEIKMI